MNDIPPGDRRRAHPGGVVLGVVLAVFLGPMIVFSGPAGAVVIGLLATMGAFVLVAQDNGFARGMGIGFLIAGAIVLLLVGACFALISGIE